MPKKPAVMGTGMTDMGMGMATGTEMSICTCTRNTPAGYIIPVSNTTHRLH